MPINPLKDFIIPVDVNVPLHITPNDLHQQIQARAYKFFTELEKSTDISKSKLVEDMHALRTHIKRLEPSTHPLKSVSVYFALKLPTLVLGQPGIAKQLGFLTPEQIEQQYPTQKITFLQITSQYAVQASLIKPLSITLTPQEPTHLHPNYREKHTTTLWYTDSVPFRHVFQAIQGLSLDIPHTNDAGSLATFKYRISKAVEAPRRKLTPLFA